ncbi:MAG: hypothetical protein QXN71_04050 [Candidatus Aenigmatarchaeota archaeon]
MSQCKYATLGILALYIISTIPVYSQEACSEMWVCTDWSFCLGSGVQIRTCKDINRCGTENSKPPEVQECTPIAVRESVPPQEPPDTGGVTGLLVTNAPTILGLVALSLLVAAYILYRKWKEIKMFVSAP